VLRTCPPGVAAACASVGHFYGDRQAPPVRMLPHDIDRGAVVDAARRIDALGKNRVAIGVNESELAPVVLDFDAQPHLVVFGDTESGKTGLLRNIATGLTENATPKEVKIIVADFRRTLLGAVDDDYLGGYATAAQACGELMTALATTLKGRQPPSDITQRQLKDRSWWEGPEVFVLIDDYDLIPGGSLNHPFGPLVEYLPQDVRGGPWASQPPGCQRAGARNDVDTGSRAHARELCPGGRDR
jgi:S-DNA-T family DNA segregation ATPase FtsK/SpoIIIE